MSYLSIYNWNNIISGSILYNIILSKTYKCIKRKQYIMYNIYTSNNNFLFYEIKCI